VPRSALFFDFGWVPKNDFGSALYAPRVVPLAADDAEIHGRDGAIRVSHPNAVQDVERLGAKRELELVGKR
jgi:hypothetical protein